MSRRSVSYFLMTVQINHFLVTKLMLQYCLGKPSTLFLRISARAPTSTLPQRAPTRQSIKSNKRSSRIGAPRPSFLSSLNSRDTRKTFFSYHFIYNILAFNYGGITAGEQFLNKWHPRLIALLSISVSPFSRNFKSSGGRGRIFTRCSYYHIKQ